MTKYTRFIMIGLAFVFLIYIFFIIYQGRTKNNEQNTPLPYAGETQQQWETKTDDRPPVTIKVVPVEVDKNAQTWKFDIVFDTHSGSLDQDLLQIATLVDDKGNVYKPTAWEGPGPGGHHREGILVFDSVSPVSQFIELKIRDVGGIPERSFKWNINPVRNL